MITQLELENLTRLDGRFIKRKIRRTKHQIAKFAKAKLRKIRSRFFTWYRRQYFLSSAYRDTKLAIARNEDIFITILIIAAVIGYSYASISAELVYMFFLTAYTVSESSGFSMLLMSIFTASAISVIAAWLAAFILNSMAIAIMHGANQKRIRSVRKTVREGLRLTTKTTLAWTLVLASVARPLVMLGIVSLVSLKIALLSDVVVWFGIMAIALLTGLGFAIRNLLRYSLVPYVSIFEPDQKFSESFARSSQLVEVKGKLFLLSIYIIGGIFLSCAFGLTWLLQQKVGLNQGIIFGFLTVVTLMVANGLLVMFYRKRKLARVH